MSGGRQRALRSLWGGKTLRETRAMFLQARYLSFDLAPKSRVGRGPTVVLVHGLYASAGVFRPLRSQLEKSLEASTHSFSYAPGPGIIELSGTLQALVQGIPSAAPIVLIGHSLGGLIIRHYLNQREDPRIVQSVSLGAPFLGSPRHWLVPGRAGRDLQENAEILKELRTRTSSKVPHLSLLAEEDEMIFPHASPLYGRSETISLVGHNGLLFDQRVIARCIEAVRQACSAPRSDADSGR